jgi:hypothetical protein
MPTTPVVNITVDDLTTGALDGTGVFDKLMVSVKAHLTQEYRDQRIKGPEFATVYLGALDNVLNTSVQFLLQKARVGLEAQLLEQQIIIAQLEVEKARIALEILAQEKLKTIAEVAKIGAETQLVNQQVINAEVEKRVLEAQVCKLKAEYDNLINRNLQTTAEIALLGQKTATEKAQVQAIGVDPDSVIGKQKALYQAQTDGFARDGELKAAKMLVDTWSTRRMTDDGVVADGVNKLNDATIGRAVEKVLTGIGA